MMFGHLKFPKSRHHIENKLNVFKNQYYLFEYLLKYLLNTFNLFSIEKKSNVFKNQYYLFLYKRNQMYLKINIIYLNI